jgi:hypothetical protein
MTTQNHTVPTTSCQQLFIWQTVFDCFLCSKCVQITKISLLNCSTRWVACHLMTSLDDISWQPKWQYQMTTPDDNAGWHSRWQPKWQHQILKMTTLGYIVKWQSWLQPRLQSRWQPRWQHKWQCQMTTQTTLQMKTHFSCCQGCHLVL